MEKENLTELEEKFSLALKEGGAKISEQLKIASDAITKAENIAEQYGIPFYAGCSPLGQSYFPESFYDKWKNPNPDSETDEYEDQRNLLNTFGLYKSEYCDYGWEHSAVC